MKEPGRLADLVGSNLRLKIQESQQILETVDPVERLKLVAELLHKELEVSTSNLWVLLHRARLRLTQCMKSHLERWGDR